MITDNEVLGWTAAALTLLTFTMRSMAWLRVAALAANVCFICYGVISALYPVVVLHALLIPCNGYRLFEQLRRARRTLSLPARFSPRALHLRPGAIAPWRNTVWGTTPWTR